MFFSDSFRERENFYGRRLFRKHKYSAFVWKARSESKFIDTFKAKYGNGDQVTVIVGDWDSSRYTPVGQVTTKGKGFRHVDH